MGVADHLIKMEQLANTSIRDSDVRSLLLKIIKVDKETNDFDLDKYWEFYEYLDELGKVQMEIWKTDEVLKSFYNSLAVVKAAVRFKKSIKNKELKIL